MTSVLAGDLNRYMEEFMIVETQVASQTGSDKTPVRPFM